MIVPAGQYQAHLDLNAPLWVRCEYPQAFAERSAFWVIYSDPVKRERLGSAMKLKDAWLNAYRNLPKETQ